MRGTVPLLLPFLARTRTFRRALVPLAVAVLLAWTAALLTSALNLSPQQAAQRSFGAADGATPWAAQLRQEEPDPVLPAVPGLTDAVVQKFTTATWVRPGGQTWETAYLEEPLPSFFQEGRVELVSGRWPTQPGEVVATAAAGLDSGDQLTAKIGRWDVTVVGIVEDVYFRDSTAIYGSPGTWAQWDIPSDQVGLVYAEAQANIAWTSTDPSRTAAALDQALGAGQDGESFTAGQMVEQYSGADSKRWLEVGIPVILTVLLGAGMSGSLIGRYSRRITDPLERVGLNGRSLRRATLTALGLGTCGVMLAGYLGALLVTAVVRPLLAEKLAHPLSPWSWSTTELALSISLALAAGPLAVALTGRARRAPRSRLATVLARLTPAACALAATACLTAAVVLVIVPKPTFTSILILAVLLCLAGGLLSLVLLPLLARPGPDVDHRLAARRMLNSRRATLGGGTAVITALTTLVALVVGVAGGTIAQLNHVSGTGIPPGMALLHDPPQDVRESFEDHLNLNNPPVAITTGVPDASVEEPSPALVFQSPSDVQTVFGPLQEEQIELLTTGLPTRPEGASRPADVTLTIPWGMRWVDTILVATDPPVWADHRALLYTGLTAEQDLAAAGWAEATGYHPGFVQATSSSGDLGIPLTTQLLAAAFGLITLLISALWLRGELLSWRPLLATLRAIGLGERWITRLAQHLGNRLGLAITITSTATVITGIVLARRLLGGALRLQGVPWAAVIVLLICGAIGTWLGATLSSRGITPRERQA